MPRLSDDPDHARSSKQSGGATGRDPDTLDRAFRVALILKGVNGALEVVGGLLLLLATPQTLSSLASALTREELSEDPSNFLATRLLHFAHSTDLTSGGLRFAAVYLIAHGVVKLLLVAALLRGRLWAYPWMIGFLLAFAGYQILRIVQQPTWGLIALTAFDLLLAGLTWREWKRHRPRSQPTVQTGSPQQG